MQNKMFALYSAPKPAYHWFSYTNTGRLQLQHHCSYTPVQQHKSHSVIVMSSFMNIIIKIKYAV